MTTRQALEARLDELDEAIEGLENERSGTAAFWPAFGGKADLLLGGASAEDLKWVSLQTDALFAKPQLITAPQAP